MQKKVGIEEVEVGAWAYNIDEDSARNFSALLLLQSSFSLLSTKRTRALEEIFVIVEVTVIAGLILFVFYLGYFILMWSKAKGWKPLHTSRNFTPSVSIVVPTYNEEDTITHKLKNLMEQDYPSDKVEVVVIDSASQDGTVELVEKFTKDIKGLKLKLIMEGQRRGKASALNEVLKHCTGEIVVITDADAICEKGALRKLVLNFSNPNVGAVTGRQILLNPNQTLATKVEKTYRSIFEVLRVGESSLDSTPIFNGPLMAFRSNLLEPISEDTIADDSQLAVQIRKKGFRSIYDRSAVFYEYAPPTFRSRFLQKLRRGQGLIQIFLRQRGMLLNGKYGEFGVIVFPAEFFMHVVSPIVVFTFLIFLAYSLLLINNYLLIGLIITLAISFGALAIMKVNAVNFILTFLDSQFILFLSLICHILGKSQHKWTKVTEIRRLWRKGNLSE